MLRLLVRLTLRADVAEDLLQELFLKLHGASGFAAARNAAAFATRTAVNLAFDWRRRQTRCIESVALTEDIAGRPADPLNGLIQRQELERVLTAMAELPEVQRMVLTLQHVEHQGTDEIGRQLGRTAHQIRAISAKGIASLRATLNSQTRQEMDDG